MERQQVLDLHHQLLPQIKPGTLRMSTRELHVGSPPDGKSAWVSCLVDRQFEGSPAFTTRWTFVAVNHDGRWTVDASHDSMGISDDAAVKLAADAKLAPHDVPDKVDADAAPLVAAFDAELASLGQWTKDAAPELVARGPGADDLWLGARALETGFIAKLVQHHSTLERHGSVRAHVVPGGQLGWLITNVDLGVDGAVVPERALAVYRRDGLVWKLVLLHLSVGVPNG